MIVLVGFMGAGKSTVGSLLAEAVGGDFLDTDALVEARAGRSIADIFAAEGENGFRDAEAAVVLEALRSDASVVALGGGAPVNESVRAELAGIRTVVYLEVGLSEALGRVSDDGTRPLLNGGDLEALHRGRDALYRGVAGVTVATDGRSPEEVVAAILDATDVAPYSRVMVHLGERSYPIEVGAGLLARVAAMIPAGTEQIFVVTHPELRPLAAPMTGVLADTGARVHVLDVPSGETSKSWEMAAALHVRLAEVPAHRDDVVIAFGGGVIGDLAGFVASTYARGLRLVQVPTSLLAQVDAAIGGKTGIDLPQGKNLVGTFWQPLGVVSDVELLKTLPSEELVSGLAEVIKYGLISDPRILEDVVAKREEILKASPAVLADLVARCAAIKAEVVSADEREGGRRAFLNYGHTVGHAIEHASGYEGRRHGEAVALGMMAAAYLAAELGRIDEEAVRLHRTTLEAVGLPVRAALDLDSLGEAWDRDKKFRGGVRFVLLQSIGQPEAGIKVGRREIERALTRMVE